MVIDTLEAKNAHPVASKIPLSLWESDFEGKLDDTAIPNDHKQLYDVNRCDLPSSDMQACIILLFRYADTPVSLLLNHLTSLSLDNKIIFNIACLLGRLDLLEDMRECKPDQLPTMIAAYNYLAFQAASSNGNLSILRWFKEQIPDQWQAMVAADDYYAFYWASANGHLPVLMWLKEQAPNQWRAMIRAHNYGAFRRASENDDFDICRWLLENSDDLLSHAEMHYRELDFRDAIYRFFYEVLGALHQDRERELAANPNAVFDITVPQKAQQCFYIMRHLIRHNEPELNEDLRFLLDIPALRVLAHQADNTGENALIRLAMVTENHGASRALLNIEAVRTLAARDNFYRREMQNGVDLAQLAVNRESSMTALTPGEARRLKNACDRYEPLLKQAGIAYIMDTLRDTLVERYRTNPAMIVVNNETLVLPLKHEDFVRLILSPDDRQKADTAYYQHDAHTALRYLSKPNVWMHPDADYVNVRQYYINEDDTESDEPKSDNSRRVIDKWSTFDDYQDLISMLYLAAIDKHAEPTDGHTLDSRLEMFIKEVALIGRAHNWDRVRVRNNKTEEYDDLDADRPSCYSGVKRRLFQSVQGHGLFSVLTQDIVYRELLKHIQIHFRENVKEEHRADLTTVLACIGAGNDIPEEVFNRLSILNITSEKLEIIIRNMRNDFSKKYDNDSFLTHVAFIKEKFKLPDDNEKPEKRMTHLMKFYTSADLERVLKNAVESKSSVAASSESNNKTMSHKIRTISY